MFAREESIHIDASPEAVYDYVSDIGRHPEWAAQDLVIRPSGDGRFESVVTMGALKAKAVITVQVSERPSRFVYVAQDDVSGPHRWTFDIEPDASGTRLTFRMERMHDALWARILQPVVMWPLIGHPGVLKALAAIKRHLEAPETRPAAAPTTS